MATRATGCTCLQGLELALKWAGRHGDPDLVRCTAEVAHDCLHRTDCCHRAECDRRLGVLDSWLAEQGQDNVVPLRLN